MQWKLHVMFRSFYKLPHERPINSKEFNPSFVVILGCSHKITTHIQLLESHWFASQNNMAKLDSTIKNNILKTIFCKSTKKDDPIGWCNSLFGNRIYKQILINMSFSNHLKCFKYFFKVMKTLVTLFNKIFWVFYIHWNNFKLN